MPEDKPRASKNGKDDADGPMKNWGWRLLCWLGFHRFRVIDVTFGFGSGARVEKVQCKRCGGVTTRSPT